MIQNGEIFMTEKGWLGGLGRFEAAKIGDDIFVLFSGNTPFVLGALSEEQSRQKEYQMQSPCYLNGAMDGQAIAA